MPRGGTLTPEQGWRLAQGWYANKLRPEGHRKRLEEAEALLVMIGLTGPFGPLQA